MGRISFSKLCVIWSHSEVDTWMSPVWCVNVNMKNKLIALNGDFVIGALQSFTRHLDHFITDRFKHFKGSVNETGLAGHFCRRGEM